MPSTTTINCLFDANAILKYYFPTEDPHQIVKYLIEESPNTVNNITTVQIVEVISVLYKFRRQNIITSDDELKTYIDTFLSDTKNGKLNRYDFAEEHIKDFDVYKTISETCPPPDRNVTQYIPECKGYVKKLKDVANSADAIMLFVMREIHLLTDKKCYLVTSDGHVKEIARKLGLKIIDPKDTPIKAIPAELDRRRAARKNLNLGVICKDPINSTTVLSTSTIDICHNGACIRFHNKPMEQGKRLSLYMYNFADKENKTEQSAEVVRVEKDEIGVKFIEPVNVGHLIGA